MPIAPNQMTHLTPKAALSAFTRGMIKKPKRAESHNYKSGWLRGKHYVKPTDDELKICPF